MGTLKTAYGSDGVAITCSLAPSGTGLANNASRASTAIDNSVNGAVDALVFVSIKTAASAAGYVAVYAFGSVDGGTLYSDGVTGSDASFTPTSPTNLVPLGRISCPAASTTYYGGPWSIAAAFGGSMPKKWGIVIQNLTGQALDTTEANHTKKYQELMGSY